MTFPTRTQVEFVCSQFPAGTRVRLVRMEDEQTPPVDTLCTVLCVDSTGSLLMSWDNGSGLNVVFDEDLVEKI